LGWEKSPGKSCKNRKNIGFQHRKIARDLDIVLLSAKDLFGKGFFLPRGFLRESPERLASADKIVVTHIEDGMDLQKIEREIRRFSHAPIMGFSSHYSIKKNLQGKKIGAFCGIAKRAMGLDVVKTLTCADHKISSLQALSSFALECQKMGAKALFCTEKDEVKLEKGLDLPLPIEVLSMNLVCTWNENIWKEMVHSIHTMMRK
jgi:tetraacyldisaccharide 4'-kinase